MSAEMKQLSLVKGSEIFASREIFAINYEVGSEAAVLDHLIAMVNDRECSFDWEDAAILSHQIGQHLAKEIKAFLPKV